MRHPYVSVFVAFAFCLVAHIPAHGQIRSVPPAIGGVSTPPPVVVAPPAVTTPPSVGLQTTLKPSIAVVPPPPAAHAEPAPDGGGSDCQCPNGQTADVNGWCWRRTDAASGYWEKAERCQN